MQDRVAEDKGEYYRRLWHESLKVQDDMKSEIQRLLEENRDLRHALAAAREIIKAYQDKLEGHG